MDVRAARRGASPVRAHYPGGNVRGRQTPSGARPNRGAMTWPASLPGRLLEAVGNRGPRGMTVAARERRTEPGLQTGFANSSFPVVSSRSRPDSAARRSRRRRMRAVRRVHPRGFAASGSSPDGFRPPIPIFPPGRPLAAWARTDRWLRWENTTPAAGTRDLFFMFIACVLRRNMSMSLTPELNVKSQVLFVLY